MPHKIYPPNLNLSRLIADQFDSGYVGHAVDVGASDGVSVSTTYGLETAAFWTVLCVEPNPFFKALLNQTRALVDMSACGRVASIETLHVNEQNPEAYTSLRPTTRTDRPGIEKAQWTRVEVPVTTVDLLLAKWEFPKLDVLCVDTEGTELDVLEGANISFWRPKVIVTECWDRTGPVDGYLAKYGYKKELRSHDNDIFILEA